MATAILRISVRLNIPPCPYISLPGFKKTELANILKVLSTSSVLACLLCCLFSLHLFLVVSWLEICVGSDCRPDYEQTPSFLVSSPLDTRARVQSLAVYCKQTRRQTQFHEFDVISTVDKSTDHGKLLSISSIEATA